ncbi:hypothetical protein [Halopiger aswanensis]|uniref:hypothetical protein n=1 Tax=Halopiger aswanensis TaxID=148449 RepID=UPI000E7219D0|nr:hypothetical protein [Halopiger aswanensis]
MSTATNDRSDATDAAGGRSAESIRLQADPGACSADGGSPDETDEPDRLVLVPMNDYQPGMTGRVVDRLPAPIVVDLLALPNGDTVSVLTQPDEYRGYVVRSTLTATQVRSTTIVFTRDSLETGACYVFEVGAQLFSTQLSLLRTTVRRVGAADSSDSGESDESAAAANDA